MTDARQTQTVRVQAHGIRWRVAVDFAGALAQVDVEKARHPERLAEPELVKDNMVRTVVRASHPAGEGGSGIYIKRFKFPNLTRRLKAAVRRSQAAREWRVSRLLLDGGIPTCRLLALAERRQGLLHREAFLISEGIPDAIGLGDYLAVGLGREGGSSLKRQLSGELAGLLVRLLRAGIYHHDLHAGNVVITPGAPDGQRLFLLDLHSVRRRRPSRRRVLRMLVMLADSTKNRGVSTTDRIRFLRAVLAGWKGGSPPPRRLVREWAAWVEAAWHKHHARHMRSRTRRCIVESSEFTRDVTGRFRLWRRRDFPLESALALARSHERAVVGRGGECVVRKLARRTQITLCRPTGAGTACVKAFLRRRAGERFKDLLRPRGRAKAAWISQRGYRVRDLPAARGLALLESRSKISGAPDFLIVEALDVVGNLQEITHSVPPGAPDPPPFDLTAQMRRELGCAVAALFRQLVERGVRHADMKPSNILMSRQSDQMRLWLVDLDRSRFDTTWQPEHWIKHLAQLNAGLSSRVTLLDRLRCLRHCGRGQWSPKQRLLIARAVIQRSRRHHRPWLQ